METRKLSFFLTLLVTVTVQGIPNLDVRRQSVIIYRKQTLKTLKITSCTLNVNGIDTSDVTRHCLEAAATGVFVDKWNQRNKISFTGPFRLDEYIADVNLLSNEVYLRSGAVCRYDRGFCYDPKEGTDYAAVWEVADRALESCTEPLEQVFNTFVDIWTFGHQKYLFYSAPTSDKAFSLKLSNSSGCYNESDVWTTDTGEFVVSKTQLRKNFEIVPILHPTVFPLRPKSVVAEAILRDYDLRKFPLDFDNTIGGEHLADLGNLKTILALYQRLIVEGKENVSRLERSIGHQDEKQAEEIGSGFSKLDKRLDDSNTLSEDSIEKSERKQLDRLHLEIDKVYSKLQKEFSGKLDEHVRELKELKRHVDGTMKIQNDDFVKKTDLQMSLSSAKQEAADTLKDYGKSVTSRFEEYGNDLNNFKAENEKKIKDLEEKIAKAIQVTDDLNFMSHNMDEQLKVSTSRSEEYVSRAMLSKLEASLERKYDDIAEKCALALAKAEINSEKLTQYKFLIDKLSEEPVSSGWIPNFDIQWR